MDTRPTADPWPSDEERYLKNLAAVCEMMSKKYREKFEKKRSEQAKFRIPSIVIGSISGVASFGTSTFPEYMQRSVSIAVGGSAIFIAILNAIESYMKIGEIMSASLQASTNFQKLADDILIELSVPPEHRTTQSIIFVRDVYSSYQKYIDLAPPLKTIRVIKPGDDIADFLDQIRYLSRKDEDKGSTPLSLSQGESDGNPTPKSKSSFISPNLHRFKNWATTLVRAKRASIASLIGGTSAKPSTGNSVRFSLQLPEHMSPDQPSSTINTPRDEELPISTSNIVLATMSSQIVDNVNKIKTGTDDISTV